MRAFIGLGSNMGDRAGNVRRAVSMLGGADGVRVAMVSALHETDPVGYTDQDMFVNAAVMVETTHTAHGLLAVCQGIENSLGRVRTIHWGPRTIDLDILMYGDEVIDTDDLKVPHPLMHEREFVLLPLSEIAPEAVHPVIGKTIRELLAEIKR